MNFAVTVAPGSAIEIYGQQLADEAGQPAGFPFPSQLNGTQVFMGGRALPLLYVSGGQVNAQVPFDLPINSTQQLIVRRDASLSVPQDVVVAPTDPAVYTQDRSGTGLGLIATADYKLITNDNPPRQGDVVLIYSNGLGAVNPPIITGTPASLTGPLSQTTNAVHVTIGGVDAPVSFAGIAPGYSDLYQVNAAVPCYADADVLVTLTAAGRTSRPVRMSRPGRPAATPGEATPGVPCVSTAQ